MSGLKLKLGRNNKDSQKDTPDAVAGDLPPIASGRNVVESTLASKAATVVLWVALGAGIPALLISAVALVASAQSAPAVTARTVNTADVQAAAGEFAQNVVVTWLRSSQNNAKPLGALAPNLSISTLPEVAFKVSEPSVAGIEQVQGVWSATIAATVTDAKKATSRRYFKVPVVIKNATVTALTLPYPVTAPTLGDPVKLNYSNQVDTDGPVAQTAQQFLGAYLAGGGDVTRYASPEVELSAITPPSYKSVAVQDIRAATDDDTTATPQDGSRLDVLVTAQALVTDQQFSSVTYALALNARAGRWEVTAIEPAPAMSQASGSSSSESSTTPESPATSTPTQ